jgi:hypothetical protein
MEVFAVTLDVDSCLKPVDKKLQDILGSILDESAGFSAEEVRLLSVFFSHDE